MFKNRDTEIRVHGFDSSSNTCCFPGGSEGKVSAYNVGDLSSIPGARPDGEVHRVRCCGALELVPSRGDFLGGSWPAVVPVVWVTGGLLCPVRRGASR